MDVTVLTISGGKVIARTTSPEDFAKKFCASIQRGSFDSLGHHFDFRAVDYVAVSRGDEILWIADGMTPEYIPENTKAALDRYPEVSSWLKLNGEF